MKKNILGLLAACFILLLGAGATIASATSLNDTVVLQGYGIGYWLIAAAMIFFIIALITMKASGHKLHPGKISIPFVILGAIMLIGSVIAFSSNTGNLLSTTPTTNTPGVTWTITASSTNNATTIDPINHIITIQCGVNTTSGTQRIRGWTAGLGWYYVAPTVSFVCQPNIPNGAYTTITSATMTALATDPGNCITSTTDGTQYALVLKEPITQQAYINWTSAGSTTRLTRQITVLQGATATLNLTENFNDLGISKLPAGTSKSIPIAFQFGTGEQDWTLQLFVTYSHA